MEIKNLQKSSKVRSIGICNFNASQVQRLIENCEIKPQVLQVESHPYLKQNELVELCKTENITLTAYSPLGNGGWMYDKRVLEDEVITDIANTVGKTAAQVALTWNLQRGNVVIPKTVDES